jgi:hypothetical protein
MGIALKKRTSTAPQATDSPFISGVASEGARSWTIMHVAWTDGATRDAFGRVPLGHASRPAYQCR